MSNPGAPGRQASAGTSGCSEPAVLDRGRAAWDRPVVDPGTRIGSGRCQPPGAIVFQEFRRNRWSKLAESGLPYLVCLLLLLPLMFASPEAETPLHVGLPRVFSG